MFEKEEINLTDCPHCGGIGTLHYQVTEKELDDDYEEMLTVEGLMCSECNDLFMNPDEGARYLNEQAKFNGSRFRYLSHNGEIIETTIQ